MLHKIKTQTNNILVCEYLLCCFETLYRCPDWSELVCIRSPHTRCLGPQVTIHFRTAAGHNSDLSDIRVYLFLNMCDEHKQSLRTINTTNLLLLCLVKIPSPHTCYVCTHWSLSNLRCEGMVSRSPAFYQLMMCHHYLNTCLGGV